MQLKGSGRTTYSGRGDGNATVSSSAQRVYLLICNAKPWNKNISEALQ
ncbi:MAG: hypothetical protein U5K28_04870 [Halobacteriales archaeon]|nr:hypothetical protein [Halobacteriales archaeon]